CFQLFPAGLTKPKKKFNFLKLYKISIWYYYLCKMQTEKKDIRSLSKEQLQDFFVSKGEKAFRGKQVYEWLWSKSVHDFSDMTNVSKEIREMLDTHFVINHTEIHQMQTSE